jgi:proteasome lid subunit RPN8/RPN11
MPGKRASFGPQMTRRVKLKVREGQLVHFRRKARDSRFEILAYLVGEVVSPDLTVIDSIEYAPEYADQTKSMVSWYVRDYETVKQRAEERGKRIIGFIHSHPQWDSVMSADDYNVCIANGYRVCGIVSTHGRSTRVRFWVMDSPLPCRIIHAEKKAAPNAYQ